MPDTKSQKINPEYTENVEDVITAEKQHIKNKTEPQIGLAISGGGIRSASFALGVIQRLVKEKIMPKIDYLSTVSGGGYIGSALTWFLQKGLPGGGVAGLETTNFPLGHIGAGSRTDKGGNEILDYIRQHGNYLTPGSGLGALSLFGIVLRSMFVSLVVYLGLFTVLMVVLRWTHVLDPHFLDALLGGPLALNLMIAISLLLIMLILVGNLAFSLGTRLASGNIVTQYKRLIANQKRLGLVWTLIFATLLTGSLPYVSALLGSLINQALAAGASTILGSMCGFLQQRTSQNPKTSQNGKLSGAIVVIGALALVYGLLLGAFVLAHFFTNILWFFALLVITGTLGWMVNLNYAGFHRMYRDRLMETFMPNAENIIKNEWGPATHADVALLEGMCQGSNKRPYHIINTNVVLVDSPTSKFHGRGGDSFVLSPLYCGSDATGWRLTRTFMKRKHRCRGMTLPTAMAISGAAVNPSTGSAGKGLTRNRLVSMLMGLLNLRLGYWAPNPNREKTWPSPPNFIVPGFTGDVLGLGLKESSRAIELTDGGHFENLAVYELIRRKLALIILSDGGADPEFNFGDLANVVERVRVDFGAQIRFREKYGLDNLLPGSEEGRLADKYKLARRGFAVADIEYQDGKKGILLYLKTTLSKRLPADIYGYKSANPDFPDQTTADQFFDEEQFEAYRELGYQLAKQMLKNEDIENVLAPF
ncbi:MAG: patatin-like phospholipase family protein [bacterium]